MIKISICATWEWKSSYPQQLLDVQINCAYAVMKSCISKENYFIWVKISLKCVLEGSVITIGSRNGLVSNRPQTRAAQFYFRPADYLPLHFGLNFVNPSYIYTRACNIIYMCSSDHSVHKSTINNANLWKIGWEIFSWKYGFEHLFGD